MTARTTTESIVLFKSPAVWLIANFLTDEECSHLISLANDKLYRSSVLDAETGNSTVNEARSSWQTHLSISHDPIVADIERRLAQHVNLPVEHGEGMQIIRY